MRQERVKQTDGFHQVSCESRLGQALPTECFGEVHVSFGDWVDGCPVGLEGFLGRCDAVVVQLARGICRR